MKTFQDDLQSRDPRPWSIKGQYWEENAPRKIPDESAEKLRAEWLAEKLDMIADRWTWWGSDWRLGWRDGWWDVIVLWKIIISWIPGDWEPSLGAVHGPGLRLTILPERYFFWSIIFLYNSLMFKSQGRERGRCWRGEDEASNFFRRHILRDIDIYRDHYDQTRQDQTAPPLPLLKSRNPNLLLSPNNLAIFQINAFT